MVLIHKMALLIQSEVSVVILDLILITLGIPRYFDASHLRFEMSNTRVHFGLIQIVASVLTEPLVTLLEAGRLYPTPGPGCSP